jgi:hypothetical protein
MGATSQSSIVGYLTDYARGIGLGAIDPTANLLAPVTRVASPVGKFKRFDDKNAFQVPDTARAIGGPRRRIEFNADDADYNCKPQALEIGIDDQETAGGDPIAIQQVKARTLVATAARAHAVSVFDIAAAGLAAAATPAWSAPATGNPIADLNAQIEAIVTATGEFPTHVLFGVTAWRHFVSHDKVAEKFKTGVVNAATVQAAQLLMAPSVQLVVSPLCKDTAKPGATRSMAGVYGANVFLVISPASPTLYDPSFMNTFRTSESGVEAVKLYRDESRASDILAVDWSQDIQVVSTASARRLTVT